MQLSKSKTKTYTTWWESLAGEKFNKSTLSEHLVKKLSKLIDRPKDD